MDDDELKEEKIHRCTQVRNAGPTVQVYRPIAKETLLKKPQRINVANGERSGSDADASCDE